MNTTQYYPAQKPQSSYHKPLGCSKELFDHVLKEFNVKIYCEIGVFTGGSVIEMLQKNKDIFVVAIDLWDNKKMIDILQSERHKHHVQELIADLTEHNLYESFLSRVWEFKDQVLPIRSDSVDGLNRVRELKLEPDFFYIDSSHQYEATKKEIKLILELFPNATIGGDDYGLYPGVQQAVDEICAEQKFNAKLFQRRDWLLVK